MVTRQGSHSEQLFRVLADSITDYSVILLDPEGVVVSWARGAELIEGYQPDDVIGQHLSFFSAKPRNDQWDHILALAAENGRYEVDDWAYRKDGRRFWANTLIVPTRNDAGELIGFVRIVRDDTTRRQSQLDLESRQDALAASELYFRTLIEYSADAITIVNADGSVRYSSPSLERMLGYRPDERVGLSVFDLIHPDDRPEMYRHFNELRAHPDKLVAAKCRVQRKDGRWRVLDFVARNLLLDPVVGGIVVNTHDVTDQTQFEERLRASEERYRTIIETAGEGVIIRDASDRITFVNQRMADILGYSTDDLLGRHITEIAHAEDQPALDEVLRKRQVASREQFDFRARRKDGSEVWGLVSARPMHNARGELVGALTMFMDITGRKQLEEQLRQAQKMEAVGRLAGGIAHDFNNLLTAIRGHAELLLTELAAENPLRVDIEEINRAAERASSLTRQLLAFSRRQILQLRVLDLDAVVAEMDKLTRRLIGEDIELVTRLDAAGARIRADRGQLEQVLMNLAVNARDAMPNGGRLTVDTRVVTLDDAYARTHPGAAPGTYLRLQVADTGTGMDARTLSHVFEPFFTTKGVGEGTGLGLATVYGIIKQSGGYIAVQSEPNAGTTFHIYLPIVNEEIDAAREAPVATSGDGAGQTVLLVEDEDAVRSLASRILRKRGYQVLEARDGFDAVRLSDSYGGFIHVLLTDVVMPRMGGRELVERLRPMRPGMRVLYMSGYTDDALLHHGVVTGSGTWFLEKPFTPSGLAEKLREVIESE